MNGADNDGFLPRVCPIWPDVVPLERTGPVPEKAAAERAFARLHSLQMVKDERGLPAPIHVPLAKKGADKLFAHYELVRNAEDKTPGLMQGFMGKTPGMVARISLVLAFLNWAASGAEDPPAEVGDECVVNALLFVSEYLAPMARRAYAEAATPRADRGADVLDRIVRDERLAQISKSDVRSRRLDGLRESKEIDAAIQVLVDANILREKTVSTGGRPRYVYDVNPALWS